MYCSISISSFYNESINHDYFMPTLVSQNSRIFTFWQIFSIFKIQKSHLKLGFSSRLSVYSITKTQVTNEKVLRAPSAASASGTSQWAQPGAKEPLTTTGSKLIHSALPPPPMTLLCNNTSNEVILKGSETNYSSGKCFGKARYLWESLLISHHYYTCDFKSL